MNSEKPHVDRTVRKGKIILEYTIIKKTLDRKIVNLDMKHEYLRLK